VGACLDHMAEQLWTSTAPSLIDKSTESQTVAKFSSFRSVAACPTNYRSCSGWFGPARARKTGYHTGGKEGPFSGKRTAQRVQERMVAVLEGQGETMNGRMRKAGCVCGSIDVTQRMTLRYPSRRGFSAKRASQEPLRPAEISLEGRNFFRFFALAMGRLYLAPRGAESAPPFAAPVLTVFRYIESA